jgi:NAD(P)-dependent dehydrogenase (short-subunit alcohol dehydrogenase family)
MKLDGRVAFITGGAQGIGLGIARALAGAGMKVALADVDEDALARSVGELARTTPATGCVLDVRDDAAFADAADRVEAELGPVAVLCNNAGVVDGVHPCRSNRAHWDWVMGVNLTGVFNGVHTFLPRMVRQGEGHIVNTASAAGLAVVGGGAGWLYYASKFGVVGMSEALRGDVAPLGIGVSVLCPGPVATQIIANTTARRPDTSPPPLSDESGLPSEWLGPWLARGTSPDEVGEMVRQAIVANRLYIHTDRTMAEHIEDRARALLDALPSPEAAAPGQAIR